MHRWRRTRGGGSDTYTDACSEGDTYSGPGAPGDGKADAGSHNGAPTNRYTDAGAHRGARTNGYADANPGDVYPGTDENSGSHASARACDSSFPPEGQHDAAGPPDDGVLEGIPELGRAVDAHV